MPTTFDFPSVWKYSPEGGLIEIVVDRTAKAISEYLVNTTQELIDAASPPGLPVEDYVIAPPRTRDVLVRASYPNSGPPNHAKYFLSAYGMADKELDGEAARSALALLGIT